MVTEIGCVEEGSVYPWGFGIRYYLAIKLAIKLAKPQEMQCHL
jgi:hypothetical protein